MMVAGAGGGSGNNDGCSVGGVAVVSVDWLTCQCVSPAHWWWVMFICESLLVDWRRRRGKREGGRGRGRRKVEEEGEIGKGGGCSTPNQLMSAVSYIEFPPQPIGMRGRLLCRQGARTT